MDLQSYQQRLRGPLGEALDRYARERAGCEERRDQPPRPGEIFVFAETAELSVLWAVVEHDPELRRFLVVAADPNRLVGRADVAVPPEAACGALSLRCRYALWLAAADFDTAERAVSLDPKTLERVRRKRTAIAGGESFGTLLEQETDFDPEYRDWSEVLGKAQRELEERYRWDEAVSLQGAKEPGIGETPATLVELRPPARSWSFGPYALAASILFAVGLGLAGGLMWQREELGSLTEQRQRLEADHRQATTELQQQHRQAQQAYETEMDELRQRLTSASRPVPLLNLPFALLRPQDVRGDAAVLQVPSSARLIHLILAISGLEEYPRYRLDIWKKNARKALWSSSKLERLGIAEISVALPRERLPAGEYRILLYGLRGGQAVELAEYAIEIR